MDTRTGVSLSFLAAAMLAVSSCSPPAIAPDSQASADQGPSQDTPAAPANPEDVAAPLEPLRTTDTPAPFVVRRAVARYRIRDPAHVVECASLGMLGVAREAARTNTAELERILKNGGCLVGLAPEKPIIVDLFTQTHWRASFDERNWFGGPLIAALYREPIPTGDMYWWVAADDLEPLDSPGAAPTPATENDLDESNVSAP